jgi:hypothetical protein
VEQPGRAKTAKISLKATKNLDICNLDIPEQVCKSSVKNPWFGKEKKSRGQATV